MKTFLDPRGHAYIRLALPSFNKVIELDFLIDTGFSGGLAIPRNVKDKFNFPLISRANWELADGSEIELDVYLAKIKIKGRKNGEISAIFSDGKEGLVGIEFLRGRRFVLDLKRLTVSLEP